MGERGSVKIPQEIYDEFSEGDDRLAIWAQQENVRDALILGEETNVDEVRYVMSNGYAPDLTDDEVEQVGKDPFIIAYARVDLQNRTVVTTEVSKPRKQRANRHIPNVCNDLGVLCCNTFELTIALDFKTGWK